MSHGALAQEPWRAALRSVKSVTAPWTPTMFTAAAGEIGCGSQVGWGDAASPTGKASRANGLWQPEQESFLTPASLRFPRGGMSFS